VSDILVSGLINIEVTLRVDAFPIAYTPVRYPFFGVDSTVSGVGYNVAKALTALGDAVHLVSMVGQDLAADQVRRALDRDGIPGDFIVNQIRQTPHSVILYDGEGRRQINVDLKDVQDQTYSESLFDRALERCSLAALCNVNFSRPFLRLARERGKLVATDVHAISDLEDAYNRDFMQAADVLFMSDELLPCSPEEWAAGVLGRYGPQVVVIGLGAQGALLAVQRDRFVGRVPAVRTRQVVNTIGAGDALFSAFIHFYDRSQDPYEALRKAIVFASYKIGEAGAAEGFLDERGLNDLIEGVRRES
jgi:sugar/nucleoside kinase (ribokinase family)